MAQGLSQALLRAWSGRGFLACALLPVAGAYGLVLGLRRCAYRLGLRTSEHLEVPVVVVGNVIAGGAGKTPTVLGIVAHLQSRGWRVGIVSRGYGGNGLPGHHHLSVQDQPDPRLVGDEPLLLRQKTGVPVYVGRKRAIAAKALLRNHPDVQVLICDDGLQHWPLYRDIEICVFDGRGIGNGWLMPAGPLREPWPRRLLSAVGQHSDRQLVLHTEANALPGPQASRELASHGVDQAGTTIPLTTLNLPGRMPVLAVAGIAKPESFFAQLRAQGVALAKTMALPDHYDFNSWSRNDYEGFTLICTEKDAVKLWRHLPQAIAVPLIQTAPDDFYQALDAGLEDLIQARAPLSSPHGHPTT
jgi:tetraacyldisaccharide 4'-kinase